MRDPVQQGGISFARLFEFRVLIRFIILMAGYTH